MASIAYPQPETQAETDLATAILLQYKLQPGQLLEYQVHMENGQQVQVQGQEPPPVDHAVTESLVSHAVLARHEDQITIDSTVLSSTVTMGGTQGPGELGSSRFVMRANGSLVDAPTSIPQFIFSAEPVRLDEPWELQAELDLPQELGTRTVTYTCVLREVGWLGHRPAVVVELQCPPQELEVGDGRQQLSLGGRLVFDHVAGVLLQSVFETFNTLQQGNTSVEAASRVTITLMAEHGAPQQPSNAE